LRLRPTAVDLFCGCGGLTEGLRQAGFQVLGAVDVDPLCIKTFKANHRRVRVWESDIRDLDPAELAKNCKLGDSKLDLLAGCPPCQGFSTLRTLNGARCIDDPRNDLLIVFLKFAASLLPKTVMLENVPGLARDKRFTTFCTRMKKLGYVGEYRVLDAADYGVPQRRHRLIYLAGLGHSVPFAPEADERISVRNAIGRLPKAGRSGDRLHDLPERRLPRVMALISRIPRNGGSRTDLPESEQLDCHKRCDGFKDIYGRLAWNDVSPTITSGCFNPSKGRFLHPRENRCITMREAAILQGFPEDYKFPTLNNKVEIARMIGNALPPPFIAAHAKLIKKFLQSPNLEGDLV
jgi:DNA (cytosine-5)-methyltransferase 1